MNPLNVFQKMLLFFIMISFSTLTPNIIVPSMISIQIILFVPFLRSSISLGVAAGSFESHWQRPVRVTGTKRPKTVRYNAVDGPRGAPHAQIGL